MKALGYHALKLFTMTNSPFGDDAYQPRMFDPWDENSQYAPTPGKLQRTPATLYSPSPDPPYYLTFLPLAE